MTTLVALSTKDAIIMGCDSLATSTKMLIDPEHFLSTYFDDQTGELLLDDGKPILNDFDKVLGLASHVPYNHMSHMDKLFNLKPLPLGVMFTGITSIGDRTIKSLLQDFVENDKAFDPATSNYTVKTVADRLLKYFREHYESRHKNTLSEFRPGLELILGGYDKNGPLPKIAKIDVKENITEIQDAFGPVFGGQSREIQRIVYGIDVDGYFELEARHFSALNEFAEETLLHNGLKDGKLPKQEPKHRLLAPGRILNLNRLDAQWGDFSEQNAIDCVTYFINIMIQVQRFSSQMPTVGGDVHVAMINRDVGFKFISKEEYSHENHTVTK